jgi:N-acetylmuramic acid 6-phosphate etherase
MAITWATSSTSNESILRIDEDFSVHLPYPEFKEKFTLGSTSTEQDNPRTSNLSMVMSENIHDGLSLLLEEERGVIQGFKEFAPQLESVALALAERARHGGRIIFIGVGSSGRAGLDLAAKVNRVCPHLKCLGMMGGGDCALIQAREGFEDSPEQGKMAAERLSLKPNDSVFLISASGSASFNAGFGHEAANAGAKTYCFYNSLDIPERTSSLFTRTNNPVVPLLKDIGPQAILGSTRLQGYSLARICLGYMLGQTIHHFAPEIDLKGFSVEQLSEKLSSALNKIRAAFPQIAQIIEEEHRVFSGPESNFRRARDTTQAGYVSLLGTVKSTRELIIDSVETSPTFFLNPRKREHEVQKRRAEYQAYVVDELDNTKAWQYSLGRDPYFPEDWEEIKQFVLSSKVDGNESFAKRPHEAGNFVLAVDVLHRGESASTQLQASLAEVNQKNGRTALMVITEDPLDTKEFETLFHAVSVIQQEDDILGLTFSQLLKWKLNLISNATMILMRKVSGNRMIDLRTSNNKLIDRCMRLLHEQWSIRHPDEKLDEPALYRTILDVYNQQKKYQDRGEYSPGTLKIVYTMLEKKCSMEEAIIILRDKDENIDQI